MKNRTLNALRFCLLLIVVVVYSRQSATAQTKNYDSYTLFVFNFMKHVNWPENGTTTYRIGVVEDAVMMESMKKSLESRKINGKAISVELIKIADPLSNFDILYISSGKSSLTEKVALSCGNKPVLIISERDDQLKKGACIAFTTLDDGSLRFKLNEGEINKRQLQVTSSLKSLALN